ncbi:porin family protein [Brevundimonas sp.]|uniref:porin family protein n=1 Tax=Brevundimonas sp. TaxID=1871086 RepID=UPI001A1BA780|nr:porin family protein [Brevundimonas sp.]MBJ7486082.1 porin family protein [Brevundimonas sp.]
MRNIILSAAAISLFAVPAMAQSLQSPTYYGTLGYSQMQGDDADLGAVTGRLGAKLTPYLGVEGETSFGVGHDDVSFAGVDGKVEHRYDVAAYGVATLPVQPNFDLFARVGYGVTEVKASAAGVAASDHSDSVNYGVGANYHLDGVNGIRADWTRRDFQDDNAGEADVYSLSFVRKF